MLDSCAAKSIRFVRYTDCVAHVCLEAEALRGAEGSRVEAQQTLPVAGRVQALHGPLQHL